MVCAAWCVSRHGSIVGVRGGSALCATCTDARALRRTGVPEPRAPESAHDHPGPATRGWLPAPRACIMPRDDPVALCWLPGRARRPSTRVTIVPTGLWRRRSARRSHGVHPGHARGSRPLGRVGEGRSRWRGGIPAMLRRMLIALDSTPSGAAAVDWALDWAGRTGAVLIGLAVVPEPVIGGQNLSRSAGATSRPGAIRPSSHTRTRPCTSCWHGLRRDVRRQGAVSGGETHRRAPDRNHA